MKRVANRHARGTGTAPQWSEDSKLFVCFLIITVGFSAVLRENKGRELLHCASPTQSLSIFLPGDVRMWEHQNYHQNRLTGLCTLQLNILSLTRSSLLASHPPKLSVPAEMDTSTVYGA